MNPRRVIILCSLAVAVGITFSCSSRTEHVAEAVDDSDSLLFMHVRGVNTFISDSGVMRYHMVAEEWDILNGTQNQPPTWNFLKGLLMERYDEDFHIDLYVRAVTPIVHSWVSGRETGKSFFAARIKSPLSSITVRPQPVHFILTSAPVRVISHSEAPQAWGLRMITRSPTAKSLGITAQSSPTQRRNT